MIEILLNKVRKCPCGQIISRRIIARLLIPLSIMALGLGFAAGCNPKDSSQELQYFPVRNVHQTQSLLLAIEGNLVLEDGCLRVEHKVLFWQQSSYLVIWPFGYSWVSEDNRIWVLNEKAEKVAKVGDYVKGGGGHADPSSVKFYTGQDPPSEIEGSYFVLGSIRSQ